MLAIVIAALSNLELLTNLDYCPIYIWTILQGMYYNFLTKDSGYLEQELQGFTESLYLLSKTVEHYEH